ncbi:ABC transporter permease [Streptomyces sp. NPDC090106]|uniref:ABC transporter permease n=1 Tax=Streptomyces sp. NPDC090106 TaxID=3365946 RepID=UPI0038304EBD
MSVLGRVVRSGVGRRRVQTLVVALATMMAVAAAVVAGSLMVAADAPFAHAFAQQNGAHVTAEYDPGKATDAQVRATGDVDGVTATSGPYPVTSLSALDEMGRQPPAMTLAGRSDPDSDVDRLDLKSGRWVRASGEIVLDAAFDGPAFRLGDTLKTPDGTTLRVVGFALSVGRTADAWATPEQVNALATKDSPVTRQMLYRFDEAGTKEQIAADRGRLAAAVPSGALLGTLSWLDTKRAADSNAAATVPFLFAFGILGVVMSVIIVGSVVSGAVGTGLRRIGILKAIGFTPREVVRAYVAQALLPAGAGIALGIVLGNLMALPLLSDTETIYGTASLAVAWWVDVLVAVGTVGVVGLAALVPALRAGRLSTVEAIEVGRAPRSGRGRWAHRAAGRLPLPRAVTYGLAGPFTHPVRTLAMLLAVAFGTVAATFALGLTSSLDEVGRAQDPESNAAVTVFSGPPGAEADPAGIRAAIDAQTGTASSYGVAQADVTVAGISGTVDATLYDGDIASGAHAMIDGHWLTGGGQVVVSTRFLETTATKIGDTVRVTYGKETRTLRIVGEGFGTDDDRFEIQASASDFPAAVTGVFMVQVTQGTDAARYAEQLNATVGALGGEARANAPSQQDTIIILLDAMAALLTLMLVSVAGLGVLNSVVLDTRERVHDLGVCKAVGMTPRQTVGLVLASVAGIGVIGGAIGVPVGYALHAYVLPVMAEGAGTRLPNTVLDVYDTPELLLLGAAGLLIAVLGALLPAGWAARTRTATALRTE